MIAEIEVKLLANLAQRVKFMRRIKGMSQDELARKANLSRTTVGNVEKEAYMPNLHLIVKLGVAFDLPIYLFFVPVGTWKQHVAKISAQNYGEEVDAGI